MVPKKDVSKQKKRTEKVNIEELISTVRHYELRTNLNQKIEQQLLSGEWDQRRLAEGLKEMMNNILEKAVEDIRAAFKRGNEEIFEEALEEILEQLEYYKEKAEKFSVYNNEKAADQYVKELVPLLKEAQSKGHKTEQSIANYFNEVGKTTRRGKPFSQVAINRLIKKAEKLNLL